jgi:hypothetical protein
MATRAKTYRHPRTGQKRASRRPLWIDRLPQEVRDAIVAARAEGKTWKQIAQLASEKSRCTIPVTTVQRWYDLRIEQPSSGLGAIAPLLREIIELLKSRLPAVSE